MRLIFMGTPDFSVPSLNALHEAGHDVCAVYTRLPTKKGRGMSAQLTPVHECAEALGLTVFTPENFNTSETVSMFASHQADLAVRIKVVCDTTCQCGMTSTTTLLVGVHLYRSL